MKAFMFAICSIQHMLLFSKASHKHNSIFVTLGSISSHYLDVDVYTNTLGKAMISTSCVNKGKGDNIDAIL